MDIPTRYEDLTVYQFQKIEALKKLKDIELIDRAVLKLSILSGLPVEQIESMEAKEVYRYLVKAAFLNYPIHAMPVKETFSYGLKRFKFIKDIQGYTISQHNDYTEFLKAVGNDYISCLPELLSLCHLELGLKGYKYNSDNHFKKVDMFRQMKLKDCLGAVFFYSNCLKSYSKIIKTYSETSTEIIKDWMTEMENNKEFQDFLSNGGGSTRLA